MNAPRKPAVRRSEIPARVLAQLNAGQLESGNLVEGLAIDMAKLLRAAVPGLRPAAVAQVRQAAEFGITRRMELCARVLYDEQGLDALPRLAGHRSDTVRGWACYLVGLAPDLSLARRLKLLRPLADDPHFGVREWAWIPLRPHLARELDAAIALLQPWTRLRSTNLRRYAVEVTRPCGVWTNHITELKRAPMRGLPLLEPLRAAREKYVQDSVANWLNDASKTNPDWVRQVCERWLRESPCEATERICARAQRSL